MYKIPLYSKTPEYTGFPEFYDKAKDMNIWIDGKKYLDMCHHLGTHLLGYSNSYVNHHVKKCIDKGNTSLLNHKYMEKLSNLMLGIHGWADCVRFGNSGGEAIYLAYELAKEKKRNPIGCWILFAGYHGWELQNYVITKEKEQLRIINLGIDGINRIINEKADRPDILVFELVRHEYPKPKTIKILKEWQKQGTILILDEITSGFKFSCGGAHLLYDLVPDICVFSKCIANGYSMSIIIGKEKYMESDLWISSTNWSDGIGFVAAYHTIKMLKHCDYRLLVKLGNSIKKIWQTCSRKHEIKIKVGEVPQIMNFEFDYKNKLDLKSYFIQEMLKENILASDQFYPSFKHTAKHIGKYAKACNKVFSKIKKNFDNIENLVYNKLKVLDK